MLFERCHTKNRNRSLKQHLKHNSISRVKFSWTLSKSPLFHGYDQCYPVPTDRVHTSVKNRALESCRGDRASEGASLPATRPLSFVTRSVRRAVRRRPPSAPSADVFPFLGWAFREATSWCPPPPHNLTARPG